MATQLFPNALSTTPNSKKGVFSPGSSSRRQSFSNVSGNSSSQGIGYSPGSNSSPQPNPTTPAGSGIPSFRTLRSLLPFGSNKNGSSTSTSSPNTSRSPFSNFGSVRRSMNKDRERKSSLSNEATPVISIDPAASDALIRRSVSLSRLEKPLPRQPELNEGSSDLFSVEGLSTSDSRFSRRTPSPGPAELSIIIEADTSGVSKHVPFFETDAKSSDPLPSTRPRGQSTLGKDATKAFQESEFHVDGDTSMLELPTDHIADQVREALRKSTSSTQSMGQWHEGGKEPVVIDADEHPTVADASFSLDNITHESPIRQNSNPYAKNASSHSLQLRGEAKHLTPSPTIPTYPPSPGSASRLPRASHTSSFLPRLRSSQSPSSPTSPGFFLPTPSPTRTSPSSAATPQATPIAARRPAIAINGDDYSLTSPPRSPSSPGLSSTSTSTPARRTVHVPRSTRLFSPPAASASASRSTSVLSGLKRSESTKTPPSNGSMTASGLVSRTLRQVMLGTNRSHDGVDSLSQPSSTPSRNSLDSRRAPSSNSIGLGRPSLEIRRGSSFDSRSHQHSKLQDYKGPTRGSASPERPYGSPANTDASPVAEHDPHYRPSFDSTRPSFDTSSRPGSVARMRERERERQRTPSLRVTDATGERVPPPRESFASGRQRKRSMSVQERFPQTRSAVAATITRPGSSASVHGTRGNRRTESEGGSGYETAAGGSGGLGPRLEWLGPRTAKAFRAAGLLDFDREQERDKERSSEISDATSRLRSGSVGGIPSPSPSGSNAAMSNRYGTMRSASEYNPVHGRAHSRMAFSEIGGPASSSGHHGGRRGSGTFSAYGGSASAHGGGSVYGHAGLMESPTFTLSSSSRERDTPKSSTSTAPTSLSESFGYLGRERSERDRDREEIRELRERHATEMGALLAALSDTQRTVRLLREENSQLRDRLDQFANVGRENDSLRETCEMLENEVVGLRTEYEELQHEIASSRSLRAPGGLTQSWSQSTISSGGFRTPMAKPGNSSPLAVDTTPQFLRQGDHEEEIYSNTIIIHDDVGGDDEPEMEQSATHHNPGLSDVAQKSASATPSLRRRLSNTSSIFPVPPANMTMLLHDDGTNAAGEVNQSNIDHSQFHFTFPAQSASKAIVAPQPRSSRSRSRSRSPPITYASFTRPGHYANKSITSTTSISPTTANFSMTTGSPSSLCLRPEHEILLGDMESLDLGAHDVDVDSAASTIDRLASRDGW